MSEGQIMFNGQTWLIKLSNGKWLPVVSPLEHEIEVKFDE